MELGLDDLECTSEALRAWSPLRTQAQEVAELWRTGRLQEPPEGLEALSYSLIDTHRVNAHELYDHFWGDRETAEHNLWPFEHYCILGHATALYVLAWAASSRREFIEAEYFLTTAVAMLRMDDHDFFEHTSWPFTSFDLLSNLYFVRLQWPFQATHVKPHPEGSGHLRTRLPLVWPSYAPRCWPHCPTERPEWSKRPLKVWWTSKNPGPFVDFATLVERWMGDRYAVSISHNALADHCEYARYKDWLCSKDERFKEVMQEQRILSEMSQADCGEERGQWCGLKELHEAFDPVIGRFEAAFPELKQVDLFACGHPLFWCRLVESFEAPILGIWDMTHLFAVPEHLQETWTSGFLRLFEKKQNLLVAMSAYHSFQIQWLLNLRSAYFQPVTPDVALRARYHPLRQEEVLVSKFRTPYDIELLQRLAAKAASSFPFRFVAWDDMPCGKDCTKAELGHFRASVLSAYDTSPMKLTEFYAMAMPIFIFSGGLWRTAMRWAKADAKSGGPNASWPGRHFHHLEAPTSSGSAGNASIARALQQETEAISWEQPWQVFEKEPLPYSPFMQNRAELVAPGAAFWVQLTDWALLPHLLHYESASHLLQMLWNLSLEELMAISERMAAHYAKLLVASVHFWRGVIISLVEEKDASMWKG